MPLHRLFACVLEHVDAVLFLAFHCEEQGVMLVGVDVMGEASRSALILEDTLTGVDVDAAGEFAHLDDAHDLMAIGVTFYNAGEFTSPDGTLVVHESVDAVLRRGAHCGCQADEPKKDVSFHSSKYFQFSIFTKNPLYNGLHLRVVGGLEYGAFCL